MINKDKQELAVTRFPIKSESQKDAFQFLRKSQSYASPIKEKVRSKHQVLPPIDSPFLKKTVNSLFFEKSPQKMPMKRQEHENKSSTVHHRQDAFLLKVHQNLRNSETLGQVQRIPKSYSQKKHDLCQRKVNESDKWKTILKSKTIRRNQNERNTTQGSERGQITSKQILRKILRISDRQKEIIKNSHQTQIRRQLKESKPSTFIMMQKLNKELYVEQKEQIKLVRGLMKNSQNDPLVSTIKVKNYTKFMPLVISIQN